MADQHKRGQYPDGLRGKMIVHDLSWEATLNVTQQIYLSMSDWYHTEMPYLIHDYLSIDNGNGDIESPDAFLVNDSTQIQNFTFETGKRYLLRIASMSALACGEFQIAYHTLIVVAVDGVAVQAKEVNKIILCAGQRYDVIIVGQDDPAASFEWVVKMTTDTLTDSLSASVETTVSGVLQYGSGGRTDAATLKSFLANTTSSDALDDTTLVPLDGKPLLTGVNNSITFASNQTYYDSIGTRSSIGDQPWMEPKTPSLYTLLTTGANAMSASTYGPGSVPHILNSGDIVQIYMENAMAYPHPMHLHVSEIILADPESKLTFLGPCFPGRSSRLWIMERKRH